MLFLLCRQKIDALTVDDCTHIYNVCHHGINRFSINRITRVIGFPFFFLSFFSFVRGRKSSCKSGFFSIMEFNSCSFSRNEDEHDFE